jgi:hypothetical protein
VDKTAPGSSKVAGFNADVVATSGCAVSQLIIS